MKWDAFGRMVETSTYSWIYAGWWSTQTGKFTAVYDALGRRLRTTDATPDANGNLVNQPPIDSHYDPEVEFLELGVTTATRRQWKVYGPDLEGGYGSLQGIGGLEAVHEEVTDQWTYALNDRFGHTVAWKAGSAATTWSDAKFNAYGQPENRTVPQLSVRSAENTNVATVSLWRGKRMDSTGLYWLGARYYDPVAGRFLSPDPLGHGSSASLYDYAGGDPVNRVDPDGRMAQNVGSYFRSRNSGRGTSTPSRTASILEFNMYGAAATAHAFITGFRETLDYLSGVQSGYHTRQNQWGTESLPFLGVRDGTRDYSPERYGAILADLELAAVLRGGAKMTGAGFGGPKLGPMVPATLGPATGTASVPAAASSGAIQFVPPTAFFNSPTPQSEDYSGPKPAPATGKPNSIWETVYPNGNRRVTYFDDKGEPFSREDYGQISRHWVKVGGVKFNLKHTPHEHQTRLLQAPNGRLYYKNQVRLLDQNGRPISDWVNEAP